MNMDKPLPAKALASRYLPIMKLAIGETTFITGMPETVQKAVSKWGYRVNMAFRTNAKFSAKHNSIGCFVTRIG